MPLAAERNQARRLLAELTDRETEVLAGIAEGQAGLLAHQARHRHGVSAGRR
jgi:FixJ family two-component response regulator